jgi:thiol-disulfide isomerase/thioredoxin
MPPRAYVAWLLALASAATPVIGMTDVRSAQAQPASGRPWLGVSMSKDGQGPGVLVGHVVHGSPAEKCGLREGDRIVRIGAAIVATGQDVVGAVATHAVGEALEVAFVRDGREASVRAALGPFPSVDDVVRMDLVGMQAPAWGPVISVGGSFPSGVSKLLGRVVLLDFWATWCGPCRIVIPKLSQLQSRHGSEGLTVLGLSSEEPAPVLEYVRREAPRYAIAVDRDAETARRYGVVSLPTVVAIDRQGKVRDVFIGYDPDGDARLEATVRQLLAERSAPP